MQAVRPSQRGIAHVALIALIVVVVAAIAGIGYFVMNKGKDSVAQTAAEKAVETAAKAECAARNDKDLCKFLLSWKEVKKSRITMTSSDGSRSVIENDGDNSRIMVSGEAAYEMITIGKTNYTKAGDTWYKLAELPKADEVPAPPEYKVEFDEPAEGDAPTADKTKYTKLGKEACGNLNCFKYEVVDPDAEAGSKQFIWFDDKDYQLRRLRSETKDVSSDMTFEYANVSVKAPATFKELGPNQYIMPGSSEPMTLPSAADFQ